MIVENMCSCSSAVPPVLTHVTLHSLQMIKTGKEEDVPKPITNAAVTVGISQKNWLFK